MNKNRKWLVLSSLLLAILLIIGVLIWTNYETEEPVSKNETTATTEDPVGEIGNRYIGHVKVDVKNHRLEGSLHIKSKNTTGVEQKVIYFHLYPNQFKNSNELKGPVWEYALGKEGDRKTGSIDINEVKVEGKKSKYSVKDTILEVPLENWAIGEDVDIEIDFKLSFPQNNGRFSYDESASWLGNWLPIIAVYDQNGWNLDPYYPVGDPFYSDVANYDLQITLPKGYQIASSGIETDQEVIQKGDYTTYKISAHNMRDFAMVVMDKNYRVLEDQVDGITVRTWYLDSDSKTITKQLHQIGKDSLLYFSDKYGKYPYKEYDIVRTGGFFGGMEYPGLVFIQGSYFKTDNKNGMVAVAHETAHQWWYGLVGNDEVKVPWIDESLTEYATLRFLLDKYPSIGANSLDGKEKRLSDSDLFEEKNEYVGNSVDHFSGWSSYGLLVYIKGPMMFYKLEQAIGSEKMNQALREYFTKYQYKNAQAKDLIEVFVDHAGENVRPYFKSWLEGGEASFSQ